MMGGRVSVHLRDVPVNAAAGDPATRVLDRIAAWAKRLTRFDPTSELMRLNAASVAAVRAGPTLTAVLDWARELEGRTDGRIDVAMLGARLAVEAGEPIDPPSAAARRWSLRRLPRGAMVERPLTLRFDLDGVAKGWLADRALALAPGPSAMIDADGDIAARVAGGDSWMVGVADPRRSAGRPAGGRATRLARDVRHDRAGDVGDERPSLGSDDGVAHHLIDPAIWRSATTDVVQATVLADSARLAEGFAKVAVLAGATDAFELASRPRHPRTAAADGGRRGPRERGDGPMAGMTYRGFDSRTALARWGLAAVAIGIVAGATLPGALGGIAAVVDTNRASLPWLFERLFAFLAYLAITGSVVYGLLLSTKVLDQLAHRPVSFLLHKDLAAIGVGLAAIHGMLLGLDHTVPYSMAQILVPGLAPHATVGVAFGQVALYLALIVTGSFYIRRRIGHRAWRAIHYLDVRRLHRRDRPRDRRGHRRRLAVGAGDLRDGGNGGRVPPGLSHRPVDRNATRGQAVGDRGCPVAATTIRPRRGPGRCRSWRASPPDPLPHDVERFGPSVAHAGRRSAARRHGPTAARPAIPTALRLDRRPTTRTRARRSSRARWPPLQGSAHGSSSRVRRTRPPSGCRNAARAARASSPHSAPVVLVLDQERRIARAESPAAAVRQRTTSPSGRVRDPSTGAAIDDPAARRAADVAVDVVGREGEGRRGPRGPRRGRRASPGPPRTRSAMRRAPDRTRR